MAAKKVATKKIITKAKTIAPKKIDVVKKIIAKPAVKKAEVKPVAKKVVSEPVKKSGSLNADVYNTAGKIISKISLPKEIFGAKVSDKLMAQAVRVYLANQRLGTA